MKQRERIYTISKILTLPLTDLLFQEIDYFHELLGLFKKLLDTPTKDVLRKEYRVNFKKTKDFIYHYLTGKYHLDFNVVEQLVEMFYAPDIMYKYAQTKMFDDIPLSYLANKFYIKRIFDVAESFITLRDGEISLKLEESDGKNDIFPIHSGLNKVEIWNMLSRISTADLYIAAFLISSNNTNFSELVNISGNISFADKLLSKVLEKGYAETHMHMNVGMSYSSNWEFCTDFTRLNTKEIIKKVLKKSNSEWFEPLTGEELLKNNISEIPAVAQLFSAGIIRFMLAEFLYYKKRIKARKQTLYEFCSSKIYRADHVTDAYTSERFCAISQLFLELYNRKHEKSDELFACVLAHFINNSSQIIETIEKDQPRIKNKNPLNFDVLNRVFYYEYSELNTNTEILFLIDCLTFINDQSNNSEDFLEMFLFYLRIKNTFFSDKFQSYTTAGLNIFRKYYNKTSASPYSIDESYQITTKINLSIFKDQGRNKDLKILEMRIKPIFIQYFKKGFCEEEALKEQKVYIAKQLIQIFNAYIIYCEQFGIKPDSKYEDFLENKVGVSFPSIGIIYHFIKFESIDDFIGDLCWVNYLTLMDEEPDFIECYRRRMQFFAKAVIELRNDIPLLGEYLVGFDAASLETKMEPWIFAPVFESSRKKTTTRIIAKESAGFYKKNTLQNIGYTYHVGEDYRHILTGLRNIDEVITHFKFRSGDRLGHAIALQFDIQNWADENSLVLLPLGEHLDNLIWLWNLKNNNHDIARMLPNDIDSEIMSVAERIYDNIDGLSPFVLLKAYEHKFKMLDADLVEYTKQQYLKNSDSLISSAKFNCKKRPFCVNIETKECKSCTDFSAYNWDWEKLLLTNFCPVYNAKKREPYYVKVTKDFAKALSAIQVYLQDKVSNKGIYVETNPTSNSTISNIDSVLCHPSLTEKSKMGRSINNLLITINSDDPAVFNTSVANEIAISYHSLIDIGLCRKDALEWIDSVRDYGIKSSFVK